MRADFDGDGKADLTVYRPHTDSWHTIGRRLTRTVDELDETTRQIRTTIRTRCCPA